VYEPAYTLTNVTSWASMSHCRDINYTHEQSLEEDMGTPFPCISTDKSTGPMKW